METDLLNIAKRMKAIADTGLLHSINEYDRDRYADLKELSFELLQSLSGKPISYLKDFFLPVKDYPTVKVDIRGLLISEEKKILMVKESKDGKWALPGGWADIGFSAKENIKKEFREETGLMIEPVKFLAVFDKKFHAHPPQPFYVYKLVFQIEFISGEIKKGFDVLDVQYFHLNDLPPLSEDRILKSQIELLFKIATSKGEPYFD
jgi:ADP-ribose pyrophosphatase YjhB (NUDIX family)